MRSTRDDFGAGFCHRPGASSFSLRPSRTRNIMPRLSPLELVNAISSSALILWLAHTTWTSPTSAPSLFWKIWIPAILCRIPYFIAVKWGFYLLDFCYFANLLVALHYFRPEWLHQAVPADLFVLSTGPVLLAHIPWSMPLVLHSWDRLASIWLHTAAPLLFYLLRISKVGHFEETGWTQLLWRPCWLYTLWQLAHLVLTEFILAPILKANPDQETSLRFMAAAHSGGSPIVSLARRLGILGPNENLDAEKWHTKLIFILTQVVYTGATILVGAAAYRWELVHSIVVTLICAHILKQGVDFYLDLFRVRSEGKVVS